jgi:hypothetical protein
MTYILEGLSLLFLLASGYIFLNVACFFDDTCSAINGFM